MAKRNESILYSSLHKLEPAGENGFEGLIAKLLEKLTGRRFFLASSGYQDGRDMSTCRIGLNIIAVECKRYLKKTQLDVQKLLGELVQVSRAFPDLDLWVLVASRSVNDTLQTSLNKFSQDHGFSLLIIDTKDKPLSSLDVLCAYGQDIVMRFLSDNKSHVEIKTYLESITNHTDYLNHLGRLKQSFSSEIIGYEHWKDSQNKWTLERLQSKEKARSAFVQSINVDDKDVNLIYRKEINHELDCWLKNWVEKGNVACVLIGEEGDGKTWAAASWICQQIKSNSEFPGIVFLSSPHVASTDPLESFTQAIVKQSGKNHVHDNQILKKRINRWLERQISTYPLILVVLDGINERNDFDWSVLLDKLFDSPWKERVAVLMTCRTITWNSHFSCLPCCNNIPTFSVPPYNDEELAAATASHKLTFSDISKNLLPLIRKPRYMDLVVKYRKEIENSGDFTVDRLIYEDWRDRFSRKSASGLITHDEFLALIRDLAEKALPESVSFSSKEIENMLPSDQRKTLEELKTGGILIEDDVIRGRYKVEQQRMIFGFGLLLAESVHKAVRDKNVIEEAIATLIEPQIDMDLKVSIYGAAVFHALYTDNFPEDGRIALFKTWFTGRNLDQNTLDNVIAYLPKNPDTYVKLAEHYWSYDDNYTVEKFLINGFLKWKDKAKVKQALVPAIERWMSFVNIYGFSLMRGLKEKEKDKVKQKIEQTIGASLQKGAIMFAGCTLHVIDNDGLLRLANAALAIISHCNRKPYIKAFVNWALSRELMNYPQEFDLVKWVLRTSKASVWDEIQREVNLLLSQDSNVAKRAAYHLLTCVGTFEAYQLRDTLPQIEYPSHAIFKMYKENPCTQKLYLWDRDNYKKCLQLSNIHPQEIAQNMRELALEPNLEVPERFPERFKPLVSHFTPNSLWAAFGMTRSDSDFEQIETTLCAFAPDTLCKIVQSIICDAKNRDGMKLRQLSFNIKSNLLIIDQPERDVLVKRWKLLLEHKSNWQEPEKVAESELFYAVLNNISGDAQLELILSRQEDAFCLLSYENLFNPLSTHCMDMLTNKLSIMRDNDNKLVLILWFVAGNSTTVSQNLIRAIARFITSLNSNIRRYVLEIIYKTKDEEGLKQVIESSWSWNKEYCDYENYFGSLILAEFGKYILFEMLLSRIHPSYIGYAIEKRGLHDNEVVLYANNLHLNSHYPDNFPFYNKSLFEILKKVITIRPDLLNNWMKEISLDNKKTHKTLIFNQLFYEYLVIVLLNTKPNEAIKLYRCLEEYKLGTIYMNYGIKNLSYELFKAQENSELNTLRNELVDKCASDKDLFEVAFLCQYVGNNEWLNNKIKQDSESSWPFEKARAIVMMGFLDDENVGMELERYCQKPKSWLNDVAIKACKWWKSNQWAKHWFTKSLEEHDTVKAWASFKLFLKCVDRRFWIWRDELLSDYINKSGVRNNKIDFYRINFSYIENSIKDNDKKRSETMFGEKILKDQVWPWLTV
jgi:hypothetical protein